MVGELVTPGAVSGGGADDGVVVANAFTRGSTSEHSGGKREELFNFDEGEGRKGPLEDRPFLSKRCLQTETFLWMCELLGIVLTHEQEEDDNPSSNDPLTCASARGRCRRRPRTHTSRSGRMASRRHVRRDERVGNAAWSSAVDAGSGQVQTAIFVIIKGEKLLPSRMNSAPAQKLKGSKFSFQTSRRLARLQRAESPCLVFQTRLKLERQRRLRRKSDFFPPFHPESKVLTMKCSQLINKSTLSGFEKRRCEADGTWRPEAPVCEETLCGQLTPPDNGSMNLTTLRIGGRATFSCEV